MTRCVPTHDDGPRCRPRGGLTYRHALLRRKHEPCVDLRSWPSACGSGKSTLAIGLAVAAKGDGHRVAIIETDQQGTVSNWGRRRTLPEPRIERAGSSLEIERALLALRHNGFTLAVIDTPATSNDLSASAIGAADMCLIPARPSPADIEASLPTLCTARKLGKPVALVLNQAPTRGYRIGEAAVALNAAGALALPYIVQRNDPARRWLGYRVRALRPVAVGLAGDECGTD